LKLNYQNSTFNSPFPRVGKGPGIGAEPLGRFLSPDPVVQSPGNNQSYNRYSYCFNNPLKYIDHSGYNAWKLEENPIQTFGTDSPSIFRIDWNQHSGNYHYDWNTGKYYNSNGDIVSFDEVFVNYIQPNSVRSEKNVNGIENTNTSNYQGALRLRLNADGQMQIISVISATGEKVDLPYVPNEIFESSILWLDSENGKEEDLSYEAAEAVTVALSLSDHAIEQFIKAYATARTYFTTLSGGTKYITKTRLLNFCEAAGKRFFWASVGVNVMGVISGEKNLYKAGLNIGIDYLPFIIGTGPGLAIGVIYYGIDYTIGWEGVMTPAENHPYIYYGPGGVPLPK
jgi:hypothetical protein